MAPSFLDQPFCIPSTLGFQHSSFEFEFEVSGCLVWNWKSNSIQCLIGFRELEAVQKSPTSFSLLQQAWWGPGMRPTQSDGSRAEQGSNILGEEESNGRRVPGAYSNLSTASRSVLRSICTTMYVAGLPTACTLSW